MKLDPKIHQKNKIPILITVFGIIIITSWLMTFSFWKSRFNKINTPVNKSNNQESLAKENLTDQMPTAYIKADEFSLVVYFSRSSDKSHILTLYGTMLESPIPHHWLDGRIRLGDHYGNDSQVIATIVFPKTEDTHIDTSGLLIPVDLIWTNTQGEGDMIVDIAENVQPKTSRIYKPKKKANDVLAIPPGFVQKYQIQIGDYVNYSD